MLESLAAYKVGLLLLAGIVSAPLLQPVLSTGVKRTAPIARKVKALTADAAFELKVLAAEAIAETAA